MHFLFYYELIVLLQQLAQLLGAAPAPASAAEATSAAAAPAPAPAPTPTAHRSLKEEKPNSKSVTLGPAAKADTSPSTFGDH